MSPASVNANEFGRHTKILWDIRPAHPLKKQSFHSKPNTKISLLQRLFLWDRPDGNSLSIRPIEPGMVIPFGSGVFFRMQEEYVARMHAGQKHLPLRDILRSQLRTGEAWGYAWRSN